MMWTVLFHLEVQVEIADTDYKIQLLSNSENVKASQQALQQCLGMH